VKPEAPREERSDRPAPVGKEAHPAVADLWEKTFSRGNLAAALRRVERNAGAPGVDAMKTTELRSWLREHWPEVRRQLDAGTYRPQPVRRVTIPKPSGGERELGVPTALDRMIQQALQQALTPVFDPTFSEQSYGIRPGRSAHQAVLAAREHLTEGFECAVDLDLDRFFDRVHHDRLMARVARRVDDRKVLKLIRSYLNAGVMADGVKQPSEEGTPQGSPLSPLLSNVYLDDLDRELTRRGHRFVRYADDVMIYVRSERAGQRVMQSVTTFLEQRLGLMVNREKSAVAWAGKRSLLGFGFSESETGWRIGIARTSVTRAKRRLRQITQRSWAISMEQRLALLNRFTRGWTAYFALAEGETPFRRLDEWLRRRLRQVRWKEWKRCSARRRNLRALGMSERDAREWAGSRRGNWRIAGSRILTRALPNAYWRELGLQGFSDPYRRFRDATRTAGCGPACPVVWEGRG
jgi:group II intron reverse transcriptase/maturase